MNDTYINNNNSINSCSINIPKKNLLINVENINQSNNYNGKKKPEVIFDYTNNYYGKLKIKIKKF